MYSRRLFLSIILFAALFTVNSFDVCSQVPGFGVKGGMNLTNIGGDAMGVKTRTSAHIGVLYAIELDYWLYLQPEVVYSMEGAQSDDQLTLIKYNYINVPLMFKLYAFSEVVHFQLGPQLSFNLGGRLVNNSSDTDIDISNELSDITLAAGLGIGADFNKGPSISVRYNVGITSNVMNSSDEKYTNNVFQISIGTIFSRQ
jgi:hypothetical protein